MTAGTVTERKRTRLDRKFDKLLAAEEAGKLGKSKTSRAVRKMMENRLAMIGLVIFAVIVLACFLAPVIASYDPMAQNLREMDPPAVPPAPFRHR